MDALEDVGRGNTARNHVDHVGLRQHGADRRHALRFFGLARQSADLVLGDAKVARDVFEKLTGARSALAGHLVAQHLAAFVDFDCAAVQGAAIERRARFRIEVDRAARMRGHRIEMPGVESNAFALTGGRDIIDVVLFELGVLEKLLEGDAGKLHWIALADAQDRTRQPFRIVALDLEHSRFDRAGADVDSCCDGHAEASGLAPPS